MKLTIEIPDAHTGDLLQFLASIASRTVEAPVDPAPGHPELPLDEPVLAGVQAGKHQSLAEWAAAHAEPENVEPLIAAADPLKVAMDDPVETTVPAELGLDPTRRDLPLDPSWPELPPLPTGTTRWVNRGRFDGHKFDGGDRVIRYYDGYKWCGTTTFSTNFEHIEAVTDQPAAEDEAAVTDEPVTIPAVNLLGLPEGVTPPPDGFVFAGMGPLKNPTGKKSTDVLWFSGLTWRDNRGSGWIAFSDGPWAVRIGSPIAIANGFAPF